MTDQSAPVRRFTISNEAWNANSFPRDPRGFFAEVFVSVDEGPRRSEIPIRWYDLGGKPFPKVEAFSDSWFQANRLLDWLTRAPVPFTVGAVVERLLEAGYVDTTERTPPPDATTRIVVEVPVGDAAAKIAVSRAVADVGGRVVA